MSVSKPPTSRAEGASGELFRELARLVYACEDFDEVYQAICNAAPQLIDGCDHASMLMRRGSEVVTVGSSDDLARQIDDIERKINEGPCMDAIEEEAAHFDSNLLDGCPWPNLGTWLAENTPVRGMAGFRLILDRKVGALNIFSDVPHALTQASMEQAAVLTAFASVAARSAANQEHASSLRQGLESNREIGTAVGRLMAFHKVGNAEAFAILSRASQDMNIKLIQVAREVIQHQNTREPE